MSAIPAHVRSARSNPSGRATSEPAWLRWLLIGVALSFLSAFLVLPVLSVVLQALAEGFPVFWQAIRSKETASALYLTLVAAAISVPLNAVFGIAAAWAITHFEFRGKALLVTLIELPIAVSPVIAGMLFVLLFGQTGYLGPLLLQFDVRVLFSPAAVVVATMFVTSPYVARELIPLMAQQGIDEELAAMVLGANGATLFLRITLPKIRWALLHGLVLASARALGEFGAVSVVSGHIRGETNTMPLHVEALYDDQLFAQSFAVATLLLAFSLLSLLIRRIVLHRAEAERQLQGSGA